MAARPAATSGRRDGEAQSPGGREPEERVAPRAPGGEREHEMILGEVLPRVQNIAWALLFAVVLWVIADGQVRRPRPDIPVQVRVDVPPGFAVTYAATGGREAPPVRVTVSGPQQALGRLPDVLSAVKRLDLDPDEEGGTLTLRLDDFEIDLRSPELTADRSTFDPQEIVVSVSRVARRELRVIWKTAPAPEGWRVVASRVEVNPTFVEATGPARDFDRVRAIETAPIELRGRLQELGWTANQARPFTFTVPHVRLASPADTGIDPVDKSVAVTLTVEPVPVERVLAEVKPTVAAEPFFDWQTYRLEPSRVLDSITIKLRGPEAALKDERALRASLRVYAVLTKRSADALPITPDRLRPLDIVVYPPPGVEWVNRDEDFRFQATVRKVRTAGDSGG